MLYYCIYFYINISKAFDNLRCDICLDKHTYYGNTNIVKA